MLDLELEDVPIEVQRINKHIKGKDVETIEGRFDIPLEMYDHYENLYKPEEVELSEIVPEEGAITAKDQERPAV